MNWERRDTAMSLERRDDDDDYKMRTSLPEKKINAGRDR